MTHISMKRGFENNDDGLLLPCSNAKRMHMNPFMSRNLSGVSFPTCRQEKRCSFRNEVEESKRQHGPIPNEHFYPTLPDDVVKRLAFDPQSLSNTNELPECAIQDIQEEAFRQSDAYKQQQIVLYNNPNQNQNKEEEKEEDYDLGSVSYYYPPFNSNSFMEPVSHESEESEMSFQEQMRETGMRGIPPLEDDDHMCEW